MLSCFRQAVKPQYVQVFLPNCNILCCSEVIITTSAKLSKYPSLFCVSHAQQVIVTYAWLVYFYDLNGEVNTIIAIPAMYTL